MTIKTRFAPSPTGNLHFGNIRTALFSWLFAKKSGGKFLLRIEDSDIQRAVKNSAALIMSDMKWLHLDWDEGPYFQTNRYHRYNDVIEYMIKNRIAYKCYCSVERLQSLRTTQLNTGEKPKYDGYCYFKELEGYQNSDNNPYVVRFRNPQEGIVTFQDQIRGNITFENKELDDLIIRRANGSPTYNFCVVIDDMDMKITHVIRGEEHINNTPRQINILKSLNAPIPIYAHISMILDSDRKKLSKRCSSVLGIMKYRDDGFLPEAILNYLMRLGWSYGNREIFGIEEIKKHFNLNEISKSASIFDFNKLLWYNHYYINNLPVDYIASHLSWHMYQQNIDIKHGPRLIDIIKLFAKRAYTLKDIAIDCHYLYRDFNIFEKKIAKNYLTHMAIVPLKLLKNKLNSIVYWIPKNIKSAIIETINELSISMDKIGMPLRIALTGTDFSPELSNIIYFIGKQRVIYRIDQAMLYALRSTE